MTLSATTKARNTIAMAERRARMLTLIDAFRVSDLDREAAQAVLGFSGSGARGYLSELRAAQVIAPIDMPTTFKPGQGYQVYRLTAGEARITAFIEAGRPTSPPAGPKPKPQMLAPGIHVIRDDVNHPVKRAPMGIPQADELMAAFFGRSAP